MFQLEKYQETLLTVEGINANNRLFLLAVIIFESESNGSRLWFLIYLHKISPIMSLCLNLFTILNKHSC